MSIVNGNRTVAAAIALALAAPAAIDTVQAAEGALEEIVVTARKREENLQDVGTAVSALSVTDIDRRFDADLATFANAAPSVIIDDLQQGPGSPAAISIRGVGTTDVEKSFDPTTGVVLDGIFIGANSGSMLKAIDLQSVEILRGPQGTLFGRNSIAGVINVTRKRPSNEFGGELRAGYGNYSDLQLDGYVDVPLGDKFAFKLGGALRNRDGYFYNRTQNRRVGELDYSSVSPSFVWKPMENLEVYYRFDKSWQDQDSNTVNNNAQPDQVFCFFYNQCAVSVDTPQSGDRYTVLQNDTEGGDARDSFFDTDMHVFQVGWDLSDDYRVDYLFGYFKTDEKVYQDWDGTPLTLYHTERPAQYAQRTHELRLTYDGDGPIKYTIGAYAWNSTYRIDLLSFIGFGDFLFGLPAGTVLTGPQTVQQHTDSYAGFFEGDWEFIENWTLTLGGRYTKDEKTSAVKDPLFTAQLDVEGGFGNPFEESWSEFTPKASLRYKANDDLMFYGLYSKGFRAGGFSGRANTYETMSTPYDPETVNNYEVGMKSEWLDRRLRLNVSAYFMQYDDKQEELSVPISVGTGQQTFVLNASKAEMKGVEVELVTTPFDGFTLSGAIGYLVAKYKHLNKPGTENDPGGPVDLTDLDLRRAPEWTATLTPTYEWQMLGGDMWVQASWHYIDETELTFLNSPQTHNDAQNIIDASINYKLGNATLSAYGANLSNEDAYTVGFDVGAETNFAGLWSYTATRPPRTYGFRLVYAF
jgi:iron complex outermembrane receptor protein